MRENGVMDGTAPGADSERTAVQRQDKRGSVQLFISALTPEDKSLIASQSEDLMRSAYELEVLKLAEIGCCLLAVMGFCCGVLGYDLEAEDPPKELDLKIVLLAGSVSTALLLCAIYWRTGREIRWLKAKCYLSPDDDLFTSSKLSQLLFEFALNLPHPLYCLRNAQFSYYNSVKDVEVYYTYNSWLSVCMVVRVYHLLKVISALSPYRSGRAQRVCEMNGTRPTTWFAIKCLMRDQPYHILAAMVLLGLLAGAFILRIFERPMYPTTHMNYGDYGNAMWSVLVTMTTVGYGDLYPVTFFGRVSGICVCFWGVISVSMILITVTTLLNLDSSEEKALLILTRLGFKEELKEVAAAVAQSGLRYYAMARKQQAHTRAAELQLGRFRTFIHYFRVARSRQISMYGKDSYSERVEESLVEIESNISDLRRAMREVRGKIAEALSLRK